jgi:hypothetical protein
MSRFRASGSTFFERDEACCIAANVTKRPQQLLLGSALAFIAAGTLRLG